MDVSAHRLDYCLRREPYANLIANNTGLTELPGGHKVM